MYAIVVEVEAERDQATVRSCRCW